jgi:hypothetical protein
MNGWNDSKTEDKTSMMNTRVGDQATDSETAYQAGHPQACGQVDQVCCEAGGLCWKIRHIFYKYSCKNVIIPFLLFNDFPSYLSKSKTTPPPTPPK